MILNKIYQTNPIFFHFSGLLKYNPLWKRVFAWSKTLPSQSIPDDLTIVTFNNGQSHNSKSVGTLEQTLKNIPCIILGKDISNWKNSVKIDLLNKELDSIKSNYVLVSDSSDVSLGGEIQYLIEKFRSYNAKAVFNAEKLNWPKNIPKNIDNFEENIKKGIFPYLNAGLWIAETIFAKEITNYCIKIDADSNSEQFYYKHAYKNFYPMILIDHECKIFQNLNRTTSQEILVPFIF